MSDDTREMMRDRITELEREYSDMLNEIKTLEAENARLRDELEFCKQLLSASKCPNCDGSGMILHKYGYNEYEQEQCQWCDARSHALAGPERELHISPELIMNRDETRKSSFIGPSGAKLVWNDMKKDDALAGPEKGTNNG